MKNKALIAVFITSILGGAVAVFIKSVIPIVPPLSLVFIRFFIAFLVFLPFIIKERLDIKNIKKAILVGLLGTSNIVLFVFGIQYTVPTITQTMYSGTPIIVALLSYFFLKESFTSRKIVGIIVGLIGVLFVVLIPSLTGFNLEGVTLKGNAIVLLAVVFHAAYLVFSKNLTKNHSPMHLTFIFVTVTMVVSFIGLPIELISHNSWWLDVSASQIFSLLYLGAIGTSVVYFLFQYAIKYGTPLISSLSLYLLPLSTYFWAYVLTGEKLTLGIIVGAILSLTGAWLVSYSGEKKSKASVQ